MRRWLLALTLVSLLVAASSLFVFHFSSARSEVPSIQRPSQEKLEDARAYLISHFDPEIGLVYESEDNGSNILNYYPELENRCRCWNTFWVYSDNLLAYHMLKNHSEEIAASIKWTYDRYVSRCGPPEFWEVLFGEDIPDQMRVSRPYLVEVANEKYVFIDKHNLSVFFDISWFADCCMYKALDHLWAGNRRAALEWFHRGYAMFDGVGVKDYTATNLGVQNHYDTYKLALILYTSKVLEVEIDEYEAIQGCLWRAQQENGGISTWMNVTTGKPLETTNVETTALTLLVYEDELIRNLIEKARWAEQLFALEVLLLISALCVLAIYVSRRMNRGTPPRVTDHHSKSKSTPIASRRSPVGSRSI